MEVAHLGPLFFSGKLECFETRGFRLVSDDWLLVVQLMTKTEARWLHGIKTSLKFAAGCGQHVPSHKVDSVEGPFQPVFPAGRLVGPRSRSAKLAGLSVDAAASLAVFLGSDRSSEGLHGVGFKKFR